MFLPYFSQKSPYKQVQNKNPWMSFQLLRLTLQIKIIEIFTVAFQRAANFFFFFSVEVFISKVVYRNTVKVPANVL